MFLYAPQPTTAAPEPLPEAPAVSRASGQGWGCPLVHGCLALALHHKLFLAAETHLEPSGSRGDTGWGEAARGIATAQDTSCPAAVPYSGLGRVRAPGQGSAPP